MMTSLLRLARSFDGWLILYVNGLVQLARWLICIIIAFVRYGRLNRDNRGTLCSCIGFAMTSLLRLARSFDGWLILYVNGLVQLARWLICIIIAFVRYGRLNHGDDGVCGFCF